ncbi:hypothetical protein CPB84DRAFT_356692 [Gymnopilus junonius]|uniref:Uncharacterized protein n=1 Tax=Gymnopilus junonius TaxID=109634 RepID=A0A9P5NBI6_GYMJU|nr:hypothetical protein CPB84DRAFT_356692 [Gymnopilus junonius]
MQCSRCLISVSNDPGDGLLDILGIKDNSAYAVFNNCDGTSNAAIKIINNEFCYAKNWLWKRRCLCRH